MSAEPGRTKAYSSDLRWRIVWQRIGMGMSFRKIAANLNISVGTAYNIFKLFQTTCGVEARKMPKRPRCCKLDDYQQLYVISLVLETLQCI